MSIPSILILNAVLIAAVMMILWWISLRLADASIVDLFWGLGFVMVAWATFTVSSTDLRSMLLVALTTVWGLRLSGYLAWRNLGKGEDPRYKAMRDYRGKQFWWVSLFTVFGLQGAVMWLISLPLQVGQTVDQPMTVIGWVGVAVWTIGFLFESIGDYQLARFKSDPQNRGKVMDQGLWRFTRHPNYFGNSMIWWGLFFVSLTATSFWTVVSPLVMTFFLVKVSGVALLERTLKGRSAEYRDYVQRTSPFIPWPPKAG